MSMKLLNDESLAQVVGGSNAVIAPVPSTPANGQLLASSQVPATDLIDEGINMGDYNARGKTYADSTGIFLTTSVLF